MNDRKFIHEWLMRFIIKNDVPMEIITIRQSITARANPDVKELVFQYF
jgi:hypothetical protein